MHGIRNAAHPVPDLAADGPWLESPFWVWTAADPLRRPLFAGRRAARSGFPTAAPGRSVLPLRPDGDAGPAVARLLEMSGRGVKIRSRALVTTLWARLVLGDLFLHGIGGAKYDQVTDAIIERFFGLPAPGFMVLSATLLLPVERPRASADQLRRIQQELRELAYHPERHLAASGGAASNGPTPAALVAAKRQQVQTPPTPENARQRFLAIGRINQALQPWVAPQRSRLQQQREELLRLLRAEQVFAWREYAFCLYPEATLREFFSGLLPDEM